MKFILYISEYLVPIIIFYIAGFAFLSKRPVFDDFLDFLSGLLEKPASLFHIPAQIVPVILVRLVSSSAATGLLLDIFKTSGPDSYVGMMVSILESCTETVFYTMSVYFMTAKVTKTRWTFAGAMLATGAGVAASIILASVG